MPRIPRRAAAWAGLAGLLLGFAALAEPPAAEEVFGVLGLDQEQMAELAQGQPVAYSLHEGSADELGVGVAMRLPVPLAEVAAYLRRDHSDSLDIEVTAHGMLSEQAGPAALAPVSLSKEDAEAILEAGPGDEFNLSAHEIEGFRSARLAHPKNRVEAARQQYRELLFRRFEAYRRGGTEAIAPYARQDTLDSKPSLELRQAASESPFLARYFPELRQAWLEYPRHALPPGVGETFPWVEKNVESRPAAILRHRVQVDWQGGVVVLTREFYAAHSYNSSQWITGCLAYKSGTAVFQQVRSYTDQVAGVGSDVTHLVGRELLKDKMLKSLERLRSVLGRKDAASQ